MTVVLHGGVNLAVEYGFEEAVDGSVALNPCGLKFFEVPEAFGYDLFLADVYEALSASQSTRIYLINVERMRWLDLWEPLLSISSMGGFYFKLLSFFRNCFCLLSA